MAHPPTGAMPCEPSPPPMPCWTSGGCGGCGGESVEPPPPPVMLGAGGDATGPLAGWVGAGLRFLVVGGGAGEGSLTGAGGVGLFFSGLFVFLFSDLFVFRTSPCDLPAATGAMAGGADTATSGGWDV